MIPPTFINEILWKKKSFITISLQKQQIKRNYIVKISNKVKDIGIKNCTYYFFNDISVNNFDPNNIKIDEKSYKNIVIYYIGYVIQNT